MTLIDQLCATEEGMRLFQQEATGLEATELICRLMGQIGWTKRQLSERLLLTSDLFSNGAYIYQLLADGADMTIREFSDVLTALGMSAVIGCEPLRSNLDEN